MTEESYIAHKRETFKPVMDNFGGAAFLAGERNLD